MERALGNDDLARGTFEEALRLLRETGSLRGQAWMLSYLGSIHAKKDRKEARRLYRDAAEIYERLEDENAMKRALARANKL